MEEEFINITRKILNNRKFNKLKNEEHHYVTNRYEHSLNVAYKTYKITKFLKLDYINITKAALLHDFYFEEDFKNRNNYLINHPSIALENAKKLTKLSKKQENIILSHMFPIGKVLPKYKESIIVDLVDDYISLKELSVGGAKCLNTAFSFWIILIINYFK